MASLIVPLLALTLAVNAAYGLKCYSCNSKDSTACKWGLAAFTYNTEECTSAGFLDGVIGAECYKITAKNKNGDEYIGRGCLPPATASACTALASTLGWASQGSDDPESLRDLQCSTCKSDLCNSAQQFKAVTIVGLMLAAFAFLF